MVSTSPRVGQVTDCQRAKAAANGDPKGLWGGLLTRLSIALLTRNRDVFTNRPGVEMDHVRL